MWTDFGFIHICIIRSNSRNLSSLRGKESRGRRGKGMEERRRKKRKGEGRKLKKKKGEERNGKEREVSASLNSCYSSGHSRVSHLQI
jgi:curved DNA-binding protein CbpA